VSIEIPKCVLQTGRLRRVSAQISRVFAGRLLGRGCLSIGRYYRRDVVRTADVEYDGRYAV